MKYIKCLSHEHHDIQMTSRKVRYAKSRLGSQVYSTGVPISSLVPSCSISMLLTIICREMSESITCIKTSLRPIVPNFRFDWTIVYKFFSVFTNSSAGASKHFYLKLQGSVRRIFQFFIRFQ
jgi:hypothetical protein